MAQSSNQSSESNSLKARLAETEEKAQAAEFHKATVAKLQELITQSEKEIVNYRDKLPGLIAGWRDQNKDILEMKRRLESCYPDWKCILQKSVCKDVICNNWDLRNSYESKMGPLELHLDYSNADMDSATEQLNSWKIISTWITKRLDDNKKLYTEICALDDCKTPLLQLYLFYFILWPRHRQLSMSPRKLSLEERYPDRAYCNDQDCCPPDECCAPVVSCTCLIGFPWIIFPNDYDCMLRRVWEAWRIAGERLARAQSSFDLIAREKAEYQASTTPEALLKLATDSLRRYDEQLASMDENPCAPGFEQEQSTDETDKPCQDKGQEVTNDLPCDPCNEPDPRGPCEDPEPEPCEETDSVEQQQPEPDPCKEEEQEETPKNPVGKPYGDMNSPEQQKQAEPPKGPSAT